MIYRTELHCHSAPVSACATISPERLAERYTAAGYRSLVLCNHISRATFAGPAFAEWSWDRKIDYVMEDYLRLRAAGGDRLSVILGAEVRLDVHDASDFLVYGITEEYLRATPGLLQMSFKEFSGSVRNAGFLLFQAHPFRDKMVVTNPALLDGIEVYNAHHGHASRNDFAELWAERFGLLKSSGSDVHREDFEIGGGIETDFPILTREVLLETLKKGNYSLIREGHPG